MTVTLGGRKGGSPLHGLLLLLLLLMSAWPSSDPVRNSSKTAGPGQELTGIKS